jgi:hypothetical protein
LLEYVAFAGLEAPSYGSDVFYSSSGVLSVHVVGGYVSSSFCGKSVVRDYICASDVFSGSSYLVCCKHLYVVYGQCFFLVFSV